jgi:hypothetical protein
VEQGRQRRRHVQGPTTSCASSTGAGLDDDRDTVAYCRIGERSAHTWFVLHELLGHENVKNYDGSWTEYGSLVGVPIQLGFRFYAAPGSWTLRTLAAGSEPADQAVDVESGQVRPVEVLLG